MEYLLSESYHFLLYNQGVCHHHGQIEMDSRSVLGFAIIRNAKNPEAGTKITVEIYEV